MWEIFAVPDFHIQESPVFICFQVIIFYYYFWHYVNKYKETIMKFSLSFLVLFPMMLSNLFKNTKFKSFKTALLYFFFISFLTPRVQRYSTLLLSIAQNGQVDGLVDFVSFDCQILTVRKLFPFLWPCFNNIMKYL